MLRSMLKLRSKRNLRDRQPTAYIKPKKRRGPKPKGSDRQLQQPALPPTQTDKVTEIKRTKTIKRKGKSSGFDYIKKKKKINKDHHQEGERKPKKKVLYLLSICIIRSLLISCRVLLFLQYSIQDHWKTKK